jgi:Tol biopolymer transport system component
MNYYYTDKTPFSGLAYYRIRMNGAGGYTKYSKVISLQFSTGKNMTLYPNPLVGGEKLHISNPNKEQLTIWFYDLSGKMVANVSTNTDRIDAESLKGQKGTLVYRVVDSNWKVLELGQIVVK